MFEIEVSRAARRYLERLDKPTRQRIADAIDELGRNPYEGDVRRLEGDPHLFRKRVGDFRILYRVNRSRRFVHVEGIRPRGEAYKP